MEERTPEQETMLTEIAVKGIKVKAKIAARKTRDDLIAVAQVIYTAARKMANDAYDVDVAALDAEG